MNINKISSPAFKGAYIVGGMGDNAKVAYDKLKEISNKSKTEMKVDEIALGYINDAIPAYFIVTTGNDVEVYNDFVKDFDVYYDIASAEFPDDYIQHDYFDSDERRADAIARNEVNICIEAINRFCKFGDTESPKLIAAKNVLDAIKKNTFDYINGKTDKQ